MAVLLLVAATFLAAPPPASAEQWTKTFEVAGRPSVRINTNDGAVRVLTVGGYKQVAVRVEHTGYQLDRDFTVDARQSGNSVEVEARLLQRWCVFCINAGRSFKIEIRMPPDAELQVDTGDGGVEVEPVNGSVNIRTGDGHIRLDGAKGAIRLRTGDGSIETYRLDGQLDASSGDGHIRAEGRFDRLNISTGDGGVEVRALPGSKVSSAWTIHFIRAMAASLWLFRRTFRPISTRKPTTGTSVSEFRFRWKGTSGATSFAAN